MAKHMITVDTERCIGCGLCKADCAARNIEIRAQKAVILTPDCVLCGHCAAICPRGAVSISGYGEAPISRDGGRPLDPSQVLDVIRFRRTIRQFQAQDIPSGVLEQILEAGRLTHTAKNLQDLSFIVLDREKAKFEQMAAALFRRVKPLANLFSPMAKRIQIDDHFFFFHAPKVIVIAAKEEINGCLAAQNMEFVAEAHGLGVLFIGFFTIAANRSGRLRKALGIPRGKRVAATLVLGYPKVNYRRSAQREALDVTYL